MSGYGFTVLTTKHPTYNQAINPFDLPNLLRHSKLTPA